MASRSLDPVVAKIDTSTSNQNLYKSFSLEDRITLQATPLSNNSTGSAKGLVSEFTQTQFGAFDDGRDTYATHAQIPNCFESCMMNCDRDLQTCEMICNEKCVINQRIDYI
jgi:hypothetical protein